MPVQIELSSPPNALKRGSTGFGRQGRYDMAPVAEVPLVDLAQLREGLNASPELVAELLSLIGAFVA
jgi:hypothetical protein